MVTVAVALLLVVMSSEAAEPITAVFEMMPEAPLATVVVTVNVAVAPLAMDAAWQAMLPALPISG